MHVVEFKKNEKLSSSIDKGFGEYYYACYVWTSDRFFPRIKFLVVINNNYDSIGDFSNNDASPSNCKHKENESRGYLRMTLPEGFLMFLLLEKKSILHVSFIIASYFFFFLLMHSTFNYVFVNTLHLKNLHG